MKEFGGRVDGKAISASVLLASTMRQDFGSRPPKSRTTGRNVGEPLTMKAAAWCQAPGELNRKMSSHAEGRFGEAKRSGLAVLFAADGVPVGVGEERDVVEALAEVGDG